MMGASTRTPMIVARAALELRPNKLMATATASSKRLGVKMSAAEAAMLKGMRQRYAKPYAIAKMPSLDKL